MSKPLVTILTPCYNGSKYLNRFLDSIINQTYLNIQLIFINDGSIDNTEEIFKSYINKFKELGIEYKYIYQENKGQAVAVNNGLKYVKGKYLAWPDSDDELLPTSIEDKVNFLEENEGYDVLISEAKTIDEDTGEVLNYYKIKDVNLKDRDLIKDYINQDDIYVCNGTYLIRFDEFKKINGGLEIIEGNSGQNWQIILPLEKIGNFAYLPKVLYIYYYKKDSHSNKGRDSKESFLTKQEGYESLLINILKQIGVYEKYKKVINDRYSRIRLGTYFRYGDKNGFLKEYNYFKDNNENTTLMKIQKFFINNKNIYNICQKFKIYKLFRFFRKK